METVDWLALMLVAFLVIAVAGAAALAAAEVAIIRLRRSRIQVAEDSGDSSAVGLLRLLEDLPSVVNTVLLSVLFLQVGAATIAGFLGARLFGGPGATAASILLTGVLFLYGEAIPKTIAIRHPEAVARRATRPLLALVVGLGPVVRVLTTLANWQIPGDLSQPTDDSMSEAELRSVLRESTRAGAIEGDDAVMVHRSFEFGDRKVSDVMVPRDHIAAVCADQEVADALSRAIALGHRRLPVYRSDVDSVIGATRLRDLAATARHSPQAAVATVTTPILRCSPDDHISALLVRMQREGIWMAIAIGRHESTLGLATVEDLVAELVGEIADERAPATPAQLRRDGKRRHD